MSYSALSPVVNGDIALSINTNTIQYKLPGTKGGLSGTKRVPRPLFKQDCTQSKRQQHSCCLHKQGRSHEVGNTVCPIVANPDLALQEPGDTPGRLNVVADKLSRLSQIIQTEFSLLPEVFQLICNRWHQPKIDLFATRVNNKLPQFVSSVPDSLALLKAQVSLQLGKVFSSDNGVSVSIMYSYMY